MSRFVCLLTVLVAVLSSPSHAGSTDEPTQFTVYLAPGAMICDHAESVVTSLERGIKMPDCGILQLRPGTGLETEVTVIGHYNDIPLVMFEFQRTVGNLPPVQYGWWAGDIPVPEPVGIAL